MDINPKFAQADVVVLFLDVGAYEGATFQFSTPCCMGFNKETGM